MILNGPGITEKSKVTAKDEASSIAQKIVYNCMQQKQNILTMQRHNTKRETPLLIYVASLVYTKTKSRALIDKLNGMEFVCHITELYR